MTFAQASVFLIVIYNNVVSFKVIRFQYFRDLRLLLVCMFCNIIIIVLILVSINFKYFNFLDVLLNIVNLS